MAAKSNLDFYADWIEAFEDAFGRTWLEKKERHRAGGRAVHAVVNRWIAARDWLDRVRRGDAAAFDLQLASTFDLGRWLLVARERPGFEKAFPITELKGDSWQSFAYVAQVASWALQAGYSVSFIPTRSKEGVRTADLQLQLENAAAIHLECKFRDRIVPLHRKAGAEMSDILERMLEKMPKEVDRDISVVLVLLQDISPAFTEEIIQGAEIAFSKIGQPIFIGEEAIVIAEFPPPSNRDREDAIWLPGMASGDGALASRSLSMREGKVWGGSTFRSFAYRISAHTIAQVRRSVHDARGQVPKEMSGMVYVDIDSSAVKVEALGAYHALMLAWVGREISRADNARLLAIVLTDGPLAVTFTGDGAFHETHTALLVARNPLAPPGIIIPGQQTVSRIQLPDLVRVSP